MVGKEYILGSILDQWVKKWVLPSMEVVKRDLEGWIGLEKVE